MELTLPKGALGDEGRADIKAFYGEVFGFEALDVPIFDQQGLLLRTDPETSQFLLLMESDTPMDSRGYDHLGFLFPTREEVDDKLDEVKRWQEKDDRILVKEYEDLHTGNTVVHAFYVRHLLPIWFDVQSIEHVEPTA
ncbi:MAG TPA: VOC family protein [Acidimicrobiales bacterium]|nr:VOC family protein [Acidimicrobiales bacterium]